MSPTNEGGAGENVRDKISAGGESAAKIAQKTVPNPFVIAVILALVVVLLAIFAGNYDGASLAGRMSETFFAWHEIGGGMWTFLAFSMQMTLILVLGHSLGETDQAETVIDTLATYPSSNAKAAWWVSLWACLTGLIHWGLSLVVGGLMARYVAAKYVEDGDERIDYALLGAAGYSGLLVWHGGASGSAPLKAASQSDLPPWMDASIPLEETLVSNVNIVVTIASILIIPGIFWLLARRDQMVEKVSDRYSESVLDRIRSVSNGTRESGGDVQTSSVGGSTLSDELENSTTLAAAFALMLLVSLIFVGYNRWVNSGPTAIDWLNSWNALFFGLALLLHGSFDSFIDSLKEGARDATGIIIQFPIYAGIASVMGAAGFVGLISDWFTLLPTEWFPVAVFGSAGLVNAFVPSGGGQFIVQGEIVQQASQELIAAGASFDPETWLMALSYGDQWTNMIQPFWALALLGITGLKARDIMGYCFVVWLLTAPMYIGALMVFG